MKTTILKGDCRMRLTEIGHVDTVITDPVWPNCPDGLLCGHERPEALFAEAMALLPQSTRRLVVILRSDSDPRFLQAVPRHWNFVCAQALSYAVPMYLGRVLGGTELAYCFGEPVPSRDGRRVIPMWGPKAQPSNRKASGHPCSRAMVHMEWLVSWWSEPGETVLDPFCGSGTIPLAAARMGRVGIGIEIEDEYIEIAHRRIACDPPRLAFTEIV
jgi:site-specific DNA-methyltransferase (adenine-specific)